MKLKTLLVSSFVLGGLMVNTAPTLAAETMNSQNEKGTTLTAPVVMNSTYSYINGSKLMDYDKYLSQSKGILADHLTEKGYVTADTDNILLVLNDDPFLLEEVYALYSVQGNLIAVTKASNDGVVNFSNLKLNPADESYSILAMNVAQTYAIYQFGIFN